MISRRTFLDAIATSTLGVSLGARGANERVVLGVMGIRDRGMELALELAKRKDVEIRYLADSDSRLFSKREQVIKKNRRVSAEKRSGFSSDIG